MALVLLGGTVLDVQARPGDGHDITRGGSVPGQVKQLPGGVARNIAEAAHHVLSSSQDKNSRQQQVTSAPSAADGGGVLLLSVVGRDAAGDALLASFEQLGMRTDGLLRRADVATPCVVAVLDAAGEVAACVADVAAPARALTPAFVAERARQIGAAKLLVLDANLEADALRAAVRAARSNSITDGGGGGAAGRVELLLEPVSAAKAPRCLPVLAHLDYVTPNAAELLAIARALRAAEAGGAEAGGSGGGSDPFAKAAAAAAAPSPLLQLAGLAPAAAAVLSAGVRHIVLTMGAHGAALLTLEPAEAAAATTATSRQQEQQQQPRGGAGRRVLVARHVPAARAAAVVNLSGAGDTLTGAFAAALLRGAGPLEALAVGVAAARLAVEADANVPTPRAGLTYASLRAAAAPLLRASETWTLPAAAAL